MANIDTATEVLHLEIDNTSVMKSTLTSKGQATIPKAIRDHLGLEPGDSVKFFCHPNGSAVMYALRPISALRGLLARPGQPTVTLEDIDNAIGEAVTERDARSRER